MTKQVTLIDRLSSSSMRYSAVPASALVTCLVPEGFSKSMGASETREVTKSHHLQEIKSSSSSKTLTMYLCLGLLYLVPHFHLLCKLWLSWLSEYTMQMERIPKWFSCRCGLEAYTEKTIKDTVCYRALKFRKTWNTITHPSLLEALSFSSLSAALEAWTAEPRMTATRKHATPANRISALLMRLSRK